MIEFKPEKIELKHIGSGVYRYTCKDKEFDSIDGKSFTVASIEITKFVKKTAATYWQPEEYDESDPEIDIYNPISFDLESGDEIEFNEKELIEALTKAIEIL